MKRASNEVLAPGRNVGCFGFTERNTGDQRGEIKEVAATQLQLELQHLAAMVRFD